MEWYCSTGQSPQRAVAPTEEEEEERSHYHGFYITFLMLRITLKEQNMYKHAGTPDSK
jgi:hypothetical protein